MNHQSIVQRIARFIPDQLLKAESEVRSAHPETVDSYPHTMPDVLERLRQLLGSTAEEELMELARRLPLPDLRAALHLLCLNEDELILERAERLLRYRPRRDLVFPAWKLLLANYPAIYLERSFKFLVSKHRYPWLQDDETAGILDKWLSADRLSRGVFDDIEASCPEDIDAYFLKFGIPESSLLRGVVWQEILANASARLINRVGPRTLLRQALLKHAGVQKNFAANYLCKLRHRSAWNDQVLNWIRDKYGVPPMQEMHLPFWRGIPDEICREFRRWANETTIRKFFETIHDPHGRFLFWRDFIDEMEEVRVVAGGQAMIMDFGRFGVAEFSEIGNAAYIYRANDFIKIRGIKGYAPLSAFKIKSAVYQRIIHRKDWQAEWLGTIKDLIRRRQ